jgi:hypothetical protein
LADLADIKKVNGNQTLEFSHELRQPKNLGGDVGGHESEQNQDVNPSPPSPPRVFHRDPFDLAGDEAWEGEI